MTFIGGYTVQGHSIAASLGADGNVSSRTVAFFVAQVRALRRASIDARMGRRAGSIELLCCQLLSLAPCPQPEGNALPTIPSAACEYCFIS